MTPKKILGGRQVGGEANPAIGELKIHDCHAQAVWLHK